MDSSRDTDESTPRAELPDQTTVAADEAPGRLQQAIAVFRFGMGVVFVALGIVGSLLPVMQGWIFFLLALVMFFPDDPRVEKVLRRIQSRFPRFVRFLRRIGVGTQDTPHLAMLDVGEVIHHHQHHHGTDEEEPPAGDA